MSEQTEQPEPNTSVQPEPAASGRPEQAASTQPSPPPAALQQKAPTAGLLDRLSVTHIILVALTGVFVWQWLDGHRAIGDMQQQLAKKIAEMDGVSKANQMLQAQNQDQVRELSAKIATIEARDAETQNQRAALEALYNDLSANRDETALAEVEQLLLIAGQQLQLSGNVKAALIAMQSADDRLKRMGQPAYNGLRKSIAQDMDKLRALPNVNISNVNFQIDNLMGLVDELPLVYQQRGFEQATAAPVVPPKDETSWQRLLREIWLEVRQMIRIENVGKVEAPLLPPDQEFFLRENLKLRLLSARLALLTRDQNSFEQELKTTQAWTKRYFDVKAEAGVRMMDGLKQLAAANINVELPDISASVETVRNYRVSHENERKISLEGRKKAAQ